MYRCNSANKAWETDCNGESVPYEEMNEWIWQEVKAHINDPSIIERELSKLQNAGPDPQLSRDLESTRRQLQKTERGLQALLRRFREYADDNNLWPFIEREIGQATKEKEQLEATIIELELRLGKQADAVNNLRSLRDYCEQVRGELENFTFDDKRLALKALGVQVFASGKDEIAWRYDINWPIAHSAPMKAKAVGAVVFSESRFIQSRA